MNTRQAESSKPDSRACATLFPDSDERSSGGKVSLPAGSHTCKWRDLEDEAACSRSCAASQIS